MGSPVCSAAFRRIWIESLITLRLSSSAVASVYAEYSSFSVSVRMTPFSTFWGNTNVTSDWKFERDSFILSAALSMISSGRVSLISYEELPLPCFPWSLDEVRLDKSTLISSDAVPSSAGSVRSAPSTASVESVLLLPDAGWLDASPPLLPFPSVASSDPACPSCVEIKESEPKSPASTSWPAPPGSFVSWTAPSSPVLTDSSIMPDGCPYAAFGAYCAAQRLTAVAVMIERTFTLFFSIFDIGSLGRVCFLGFRAKAPVGVLPPFLRKYERFRDTKCSIFQNFQKTLLERDYISCDHKKS